MAGKIIFVIFALLLGLGAGVLGAGFAEYLYGDASRFVDELLALLR